MALAVITNAPLVASDFKYRKVPNTSLSPLKTQFGEGSDPPLFLIPSLGILP